MPYPRPSAHRALHASMLALALAVPGCGQDGLPYLGPGDDAGVRPTRDGAGARDLSPGALDLIVISTPDLRPPPDLAPPRPDLTVVDMTVVDSGVPDLVRDASVVDLRPLPDLTTPDLAPPPGFPAPHTALPQVVSLGGRILAAPELTSVSFSGEALTKDLDAFVAGIGKSTFWAATVGEYGVGAPTTRAAAHLNEAAAKLVDDSDIQAWLDDKLDGAHVEFGLPSARSLFVLWYPASTTVTLDNFRSCRDFGGYHSSFVSSRGPTVAYAVLPRCGALPGYNQLQTLTVAASHEIAEAVTDPDPLLKPAYFRTDAQSLGWMQVLAGAEVGDLCAYDDQWILTPNDLGYAVQRMWSNVAAKASHDPCVPAPANTVYYNAAPVLPDVIPVLTDSGPINSPGLKLKANVARTIEVDLFSDAAMGAWSLSAVASPYVDGTFTFAWDQAAGKNGDKVHLTVTMTGASSRGNDGFLIMSTSGQRSHRWPVAVQPQ